MKLGKIDWPKVDFAEAKKIARPVHETVRQGKLGYALLIGQINRSLTLPRHKQTFDSSTPLSFLV